MKRHTGGKMRFRKSTKFSTALKVKIKMRETLLDKIKDKKILDCYAGLGELYDACYSGYAYTGLDCKIRKAFTENLIEIENTKFLRSENLNEFTVFDLDAFGNPWHQFGIILHRRTSEKPFVVFITDGIVRSTFYGYIPTNMRKYINIPKKMKIPCINRHIDFIRKLFIKKMCEKTNHKIISCIASTNESEKVRYIGLEIVKGTW